MRPLPALAVALLGLFALTRRASAAPAADDSYDRLEQARLDRIGLGVAPEAPAELLASGPGDETPADFDLLQFDGVTPNMATDFEPANDPAANLAAFLYMIRSSEHLFPRNVVGTDEAYRVFYGDTERAPNRFQSFADHPVLTGEKTGVPLPAQMCRAAGIASGVCVSTAAGAYQINLPTWREFREAGRWGPRLPDFSPESQDEAARRILIRVGALPLIEAGDIRGAAIRASGRWASLPWSRAQQRPKPESFAIARFNEAAAAA